jgi:hypothetical protein
MDLVCKAKRYRFPGLQELVRFCVTSRALGIVELDDGSVCGAARGGWVLVGDVLFCSEAALRFDKTGVTIYIADGGAFDGTVLGKSVVWEGGVFENVLIVLDDLRRDACVSTNG